MPPRQRLIRQAIHSLRCGKARDGVLTEARERVRHVTCKIGRRDNCSAELGRDLFQPCREIHGRPNAGEIETVAAADIAVHHLANMECKPKPYWRLVFARWR